MKKKDLEKFEKLLLAKRKQLIDDVDQLKKDSLDTTIKDKTGDLSSYSYHMADMGTDAMEREKAFYFASKSGRLLYHIDQALRRLKSKKFGKCHECEEDISFERLEAVPHARLCIKCKELEEQRKKR